MTNFLQHITLAAATLSLGFVAINSAQAATLTYDFSGATDSGLLIGATYSGFLSFDDSNLTGNGSEFLTLTHLDIDFSNPIFANATPVSDAEALFFNGTFLGLSFSTDSYSFIPGFFDVTQATFAYELNKEYEVNRQDGAGSVNYTLRQPDNPSSSIPEPSATLGLFLLGAWGISQMFKRQSA
ncbi:MAG TPA: hypothetical protein DDZ80_30540 [Cyanobacteria bacterium UBA8803]|nr:hypothetical protein [Cyanobacteria bacterium UBA9273]HBL62566.1 hypothetical protein [Cyanobacteria bacterium UBA8803]